MWSVWDWMHIIKTIFISRLLTLPLGKTINYKLFTEFVTVGSAKTQISFKIGLEIKFYHFLTLLIPWVYRGQIVIRLLGKG